MPSKITLPTIKQALKQAYFSLQRSRLPEAFLDAQILLAFILKKDRSFLLTHDERYLTAKQFKDYQVLIKKRINNWPIAYLTGEKYFYGYKFLVNNRVLIPRPESELIVDLVCPLINKQTTLIDLGTGSGCLIISVLKNIKLKPKKALAIDISPKALAIAKINAKKQKIKNLEFKKNNLLKNLKLLQGNIVIMANLPYLTPQQMAEPSIKHEPKQALIAGNDGLKYYRQLARQLKNINQPITLICELNPGQKIAFKKIFPKAEFRKDFSNKIRLAITEL